MVIAPKSHGELLASALVGAWRPAPAPAELSAAELSEVAPLLRVSGAAALGWWKIRHTDLRETPHASELRQAYRFQTLQAALREQQVAELFQLLEAAGVEAVLVKGLAASRLYPEPGLRPCGDIDVCVRPSQAALAARVVGSPEAKTFWVDLHEGVEGTDARDFRELYARAETLRLGATGVRVLAFEDHLRLLCLHLLRHGAWRPLWLCDVAAALEGRPDDFDWARLLGADKRRARWVACAVGLARELLGARVEGTPFDDARARRLPRWLVPEVLRQWETPSASMQAPMRHRAPMRKYLRAPSGLFADLRNRWPNPIEATVSMGGPFNEWPRLPFQLANCLTRTTRFLAGANRHGESAAGDETRAGRGITSKETNSTATT